MPEARAPSDHVVTILVTALTEVVKPTRKV
eukprot:COSAG03_NODE_1964_length_3289_cov_2.261129_1_plen_29_part_10